MSTRLPLYALVGLALSAACDRTTSLPTSIRPGNAQVANRPAKDPTATFYIAGDASVLFQNDGAFIEDAASPFAGLSRYADGECGVGSNFFALPGESGDATMNTQAMHSRCTVAPRTVHLDFALVNPDGSLTADGSETVAAGMNLHQLERAAANGSPALYIPVGGTALRGFHIGDNTGKCYESSGIGGLAFRPMLSDGVTYVGADDVQVYRSAPDTWTITSVPDEIDAVSGQVTHHDKAYCRGNGKLYHMPVHFTIVSSQPLTP